MTPNERLAKSLLQLGYGERSTIEQSLRRCEATQGWDLGEFLLRVRALTPEQVQHARAHSLDESNSTATLVSRRSTGRVSRSFVQAGSQEINEANVPASATAQYLKRLEELGVGGMGAVYRVEDKRLQRHAAMKVLLKEAIDPDIRQRFLREAQFTARLVHPSIPSVYELGTTPEGELYFLMQVVEGRTLEDHIEDFHARGAPPEALNALLEVLVKASEAIAYAHSQGYIHRDLKPSNIMIGQFGEVMVMDWGIAKALGKDDDPFVMSLGLSPEKLEKEGGLTVEGTVLGTPGYMPPEQAGGEKVSEEADIFALGALLTCILTGKPPITGGNMFNVLAATVKGEIFTPRMRNRRISRELDGLARAALKAKPEERLSSAEMFVRDLRAYLGGRFLATVRYSPFEKARRKLARHSTTIIAALVFLSVILMVVVLAQRLSLQQRFQNELITSNSDLKKEKGNLEEANLKASKELEGLRRSRILMLRAESAGSSEEDLAAALRDIEEALELNPSLELKLRACRMLIFFRKWPKAKALAKELSRAESFKYEGLFLQNLVMESESDGEEEFFSPLRRLANFYDDGIENDYTVFAVGYRHYIDKEFAKALVFFRKLTGRKERSYFFGYRASCHFFLKEYGEASRWAKEAVGSNPKNYYAHFNLARAYMELRESHSALVHISIALALKPGVRAILSSRAQILTDLDDFGAAIKDLNALLRLPGDHGRLLTRRSELQRLSGKPKLAETDARRALGMPNPRPNAFRMLALALMDQLRWEDTLLVTGNGIARFPKDAFLHTYKAEALRRLKRYKESLQQFDLAMSYGNSTIPVLNNRALVLSRLGQHKSAIREFSTVLSQRQIPATYIERALSYELTENFEKALIDLDVAAKLDPKRRADCYVYKSRILAKLQRLDESLAISNEFLNGVPQLKILLLNRAQIYMSKGNFEMARRDFESLVNLNPDEVPGLYNLVIIETKLKQIKSARRAFERLKARSQDRKYLLFSEAFLLIEEGQDERGIAMLRTFLKEFPKHPNAPLAKQNIATYEAYLRKKAEESKSPKNGEKGEKVDPSEDALKGRKEDAGGAKPKSGSLGKEK